jgi:probable rRNA maturation factor
MSSYNGSSKLTRRMTVHVDVQQATDGKSALSSDDIATWVARVVDATGVVGDTELSVRVVDALEMQQLNSEFRGKDKPTNVLSFPAGDIAGLPEDAGVPLGDLVVCASVVKDEALAQGKSLDDHWAHMIVHGTLHLLGFDHEEDAEAADMERREVSILTAHGIANPYTI